VEGLDVSERNQRVALTVNQGIGFLSDEEMLSYFSPKVVWQIGHNRLEGHEGVLGIHHVAQLAYPNGAERPVRSVLADDVRVMVQHVNRARTNKGVDYDNEYVKIFEFDTDGKISAVWEYMDSLYASTAFNVLEIGGSAPVNPSTPLPLSVDEVLTTTRAVRHRLDFDRPVTRQLVEECLRLAFQAPNGSNMQDWGWTLVDDPETRAELAAIYRRGLQDHITRDRSQEAPDTRPSDERMSKSVQYLVANMERVPVLVVPTVARRYGGTTTFQQASRWGSILPAVWSFHLALRSRGLGSAWTTLHLYREQEAAELLGIPYEEQIQAGLFPVAYTIGTEFHAADRARSEQRIGWNRWMG
jgi:nitroreductase